MHRINYFAGWIFLVLGICLSSGSSAQVNTFPHTEDFENEFQCPNGCNPTCNFRGTMRNNPNNELNWASDLLNTPSGQTGPSADHTFGDYRGHFAYLESSCANIGFPNKVGRLESVYFDMRNLTPPVRVEFWFHMYGLDMGTLHFDVDTTRGQGNWHNNYIPAWTDHLNEWQRMQVDISSLAGKDSVRFRFRGITGTEYRSDMCLDDITVYEVSPYDFGVSGFPDIKPYSCGLSAADTLRLEISAWGTQGLYPGDTIPVTVELPGGQLISETVTLTDTVAPGNPGIITLSQLVDLSRLGDLRLRAYTRVASDTSTWNDAYKMEYSHLPSINQFPFHDDFELGPDNFVAKGQNSTWAFGTPQKNAINGAASGFNCWTTGGLTGQYLNDEDSYLVSPCFDFTNVCNPWIELSVNWESEYRFDGAVLQYSINGGRTWGRVGSINSPGPNWYNFGNIGSRPGGTTNGWTGNDTTGSGGWLQARHRLYNVAGRKDVLFRIAFGADISIVDEGFAVDDFTIMDGMWLGKDVSICQGDTVVLAPRGHQGTSFLWSTGATTPTLAVTQPGTYWVQVTGGWPICTLRDTIEVVGIGPGFSVSLLPDTSGCGSITLDAGYWPGVTYRWSNGDSLQKSVISTSGAYFVDVTTPCGVTRSDTVQVNIIPLPATDLGPDTSVCGDYLLSPGASGSYLWSDNSTGASLLATQSGDYSVTVTSGQGCIAADTVSLVINEIPYPDLGSDTSICAGSQLCLEAGTDPTHSYYWSNGFSTNQICVANPGSYAVTVTSAAGCVASDTIGVTIPNAPLAGIGWDTTSCPFILFIDNSTGGAGDTWFWDFGDGSTSSQQNPTHSYTQSGTFIVKMRITNVCGVDSATRILIIDCPISVDPEVYPLITIYPNPSAGWFQLKRENAGSDPVELRVLDLRGKVLVREIWEGQNYKIDLFGVSNGMYLLELRSKEMILTRRLLLEKN